MNSLTTKSVVSLETLSNLKKAGIFNPDSARILLTAHLCQDPKYFEILHNAILLKNLFSSPFSIPDASVDGPIRFALTENGQPVGLYPGDCHVLIAGQTGAGKTILLENIFSQAYSQGINIWLFVRAQDMRSLLLQNKDILVLSFNQDFKFNPLNPCGIPEPDYCNIFADNFIQTFGLYDGTKNYLLENLNNIYKDFKNYGKYPSMQDLHERIKKNKHPRFSRTEKYSESLMNRVGGLIFSSIGKVFDCSIGFEEALFNKNCIFEIDNLTTEQQRFVINHLITNLFYYRMKNYQERWMFVGIDDANLVFDKSLEYRPDFGMPIIHSLITTVRKSKINIFACTQTPHQIGASIHSNSFVKIMFSLSNGKDVESMQESMGIRNQEQKDYCYKLRQREAIAKYSGGQETFLVKIPEVKDMDYKYIDDNFVQYNNARILYPYKIQPRYVPETIINEEPQNKSKANNVNDFHKRFLMAVYNSQYKMTLTEICKLAGLPAGTGSRIAEECV
ncbi:MAG: ATP-binding protein, partial [Paludibacter sp.]